MGAAAGGETHAFAMKLTLIESVPPTPGAGRSAQVDVEVSGRDFETMLEGCGVPLCDLSANAHARARLRRLLESLVDERVCIEADLRVEPPRPGRGGRPLVRMVNTAFDVQELGELGLRPW